jgi:hypothetical protein
LDKVFDPPPLAQPGVSPHAVEIEEKQFGRAAIAPRRHENIGILKVAMVNLLGVQLLEKPCHLP